MGLAGNEHSRQNRTTLDYVCGTPPLARKNGFTAAAIPAHVERQLGLAKPPFHSFSIAPSAESGKRGGAGQKENGTG